jgi:hypothetical protein
MRAKQTYIRGGVIAPLLLETGAARGWWLQLNPCRFASRKEKRYHYTGG